MTDETRPGRCECPMLRMAAEAERMAECGILPDDDVNAARDRIAAIHVALARERYGCDRKPGDWRCPLEWAGALRSGLVLDPNVPLLKRPVDDKQDHRYI